MAAYSTFDLLDRAEARQVSDVLTSLEVRKVHDYIARHKEEHIALVQRDLRQPSISSWHRGVEEMADLMIESFKKLGCRDVQRVPTSKPEWPGVLAHYDAAGRDQQQGRQPLRYDPAKNEILIAGYKDAIRPPTEEELDLMRVLTTRFRDHLFAGERENMKVFMNDWTPEEAASHLTFDTTWNIDGIWGGYTGPGTATILPEKAGVKIDSRLVPNQEVRGQLALLQAHLDRHGFSDISVRMLGGGDEWSQTSVKAAVVQATLAMYKARGVEPMVWPRSAGSSPQWEYTRKLGLPAGGGAMGHGSRAHADDEYIVIEGNGKVGGIVESEQSMVDLIYAYANWPEPPRTGQ